MVILLLIYNKNFDKKNLSNVIHLNILDIRKFFIDLISYFIIVVHSYCLI